MAAKASNTNYYELLGITRQSSQKEIVKSYRKKALICHPDKNPDNPKAVELFHEISEALKILTDEKAKAAYDAVLKARELAKLRTQALDAKRKKFKQDLEAREANAQQEKEDEIKEKLNLEEEIKRLRESGSRLLKEQQELIRTQLERDRKEQQEEHVTPKLKVRWKCRENDHENGGYNETVLREIFEKYGNVIDVIVSIKKNGLGIVEFRNSSEALIAMEFEHGSSENPLKVSWLQGKKSSKDDIDQRISDGISSRNDSKQSEMKDQSTTLPSGASSEDFERLVLLRMKMAQKNRSTTAESQDLQTS